MPKILCLYSNKTSTWISCQKIVANLWQSYTEASQSVTSLHFGPEQKGQDLISLAEEIVQIKPDIISFIDHRPHPFELLQYLIPLWMKKHSTFPELIFHVYGDFTLNYQKWAALSPLMRGIRTKFCVASTAQKKLIEKLLPQSVNIMPFAVKTTEFGYDPELRTKLRRELALTPDQKLFIFTGRLSYQKNINILVSSFLDYIQENKTNDKLLIFGHFDDLGDLFSGHLSLAGHYFHEVIGLIKDHPRKSQVHFMGMANSKELNSYYNASDFLINLSTHNDEDFGMSVAEASMCGLASIMTAWGGLNDFNFSTSKYLNVSIDSHKEIDLSSFKNYMSSDSDYSRENLSKEAERKFSIRAATQKLQIILGQEAKTFEDFSELFYQVQRSLLYSKTAYLDYNHQLNSLYRQIYVSYLG